MDDIRKKKIKVVRVITRLNIGGPAIHAILLTEGLNGAEFETKLVTGIVGPGEEDMLYLVKLKNVSPLIIPELGREISLKNDIVALFKLYRLLKKEKPDIVHTHTAKAGILGRIAAMCAGSSIKVHTFHGHVFYEYFSRIKSSIFIAIERILANFTDKIIVVSPSIKEDLIRFRVGNERKIVSIPVGLELNRLLQLEYNQKDKEVNIGIVGRLTEIKNHSFFLRVAKELQSKLALNNNVKFKIIGDGHLKKALVNYADTLGLKNLEFKGWIKDTAKIYKELDIVALTSFNEGTPISLIEAMAAGRPVVATNVGGVKDLVNSERGFLIEPQDIDGFVSALKCLIDDEKLRKRLGCFGREFVRNIFSKGRLITDIKRLYEELMKESRK